MKVFASATLTLATLAPFASAAGYTGLWTVEGDKCDGSIVLGQYTKTDTCTAVDCAPITGVTGAGAKTTCMEDHIAGANAVLKAVPYVLVEVYEAASECAGDFAVAIAVTANGKCIAGSDGKASFNVTMAADGKSAEWLQYATADCSGEETKVPFTEAQLDGKTCTGGFLKALGVQPAADATSETPSEPTKGYTANWTVKGDKCDGAIVLGEYTASETCTAVDCAALPGVTTAGVKTTCVEDHIEGANGILKEVPYVLVEVYKAESMCMGAFDIAIAVTANGECIPGTNGKASYNVTMAADGSSAVWLQYATADCSGEETKVDFPKANLDGKTCTAGFLKALGVMPEASSEPTTAPANSTTPVPSPSSAVTSLLGAAAFSVAAIASASLL